MRLVLLAAAAALLITACSPKTVTAPAEPPMQIDESSILDEPPPAATLDPAELDLSKIALAMRIPAAFRAYDDGASLLISVTNPRLGVNIAESFALDTVGTFESAFLAREEKPGFTIWTYATRPEDAARLTAVSLELVRLRNEAPGENELTFGATAPGCWNEPSQTPDSLSRTLYIRVVPEADFEVLVPEERVNPADVPGTESFWGACTE